MGIQKSKINQIQISVKCVYVAAESKPDQNHHFFAYRITIKNKGSGTAQLLSRHWTITDGLGRIEEVKGPGVIGQQPKIEEGKSFEYESACPLTTSCGSMKGRYEMIDQEGEKFWVDVPEFFLIAPQALH